MRVTGCLVGSSRPFRGFEGAGFSAGFRRSAISGRRRTCLRVGCVRMTVSSSGVSPFRIWTQRMSTQEVPRSRPLDLEEQRPRSRLSAWEGRAAPRLVYKLVFSMRRELPEKVMKATEKFCCEQFALKHRSAKAQLR